MTNGESNWGRTFAQQVESHGRYFFSVAYGILHESAAAEDACQQALMKAWHCRDNLRQAERVRPWITQIVVNESLEIMRKRGREKKMLQEKAVAPGDGAAGDPSDRLATRETVWQAINELPEPTRTIVILRLVNGMSGNEVKTALGCSASEVSRRLHSGMEQLRSYFVQEGV